MGHHGDSHGRRHRRVGDDVRGQPRRFGSEEEGVRFAVGDVGEAVRRVPGEGEDARIRERAKERLEVGVDSKVCKVVRLTMWKPVGVIKQVASSSPLIMLSAPEPIQKRPVVLDVLWR